MLRWYLRQGWPRQLAVLTVVAVAVPVLWTAIASYLFVDLMGAGLRQYYPRSDVGSYLVWWDYLLAEGPPARVERWLAVSAVVTTLPFAAVIARQVTDYLGSDGKRPAVYGKTAWANRQEMRSSGISSSKKPF
jgi:hypothetical protein